MVGWQDPAQEVAQAVDALAAEDAEELALLLREFWRRIAAECGQFVAEELLYACEAEVRETRAALEQCVDSLVY